MSTDRFGGLGRAVLLGVLACAGVTLAQSCGFPDHTFVSDEEFYGKGGSSGAGGAGGADASAGGVQGSGGKASGGSATGGESFVRPREGGPPPTDSGPGTGGAPPLGDSGLLPDGAPPCTPGLSLCEGTCFDFLTDVNHCGDCTTTCAPGEVCAGGECAAGCAGGLAECTPTGSTTKICVDITTDENHCSRCNTPCAPGNVCEGSQCVADCGTRTRCGTLCVDTTTDDTHCGSCTTNCTSVGQVCSGSTCKPNCTPPFIACGSTCVNPSTDDKNCNGCNKPCAATQACVASACTTLVENCQNGSDDDRDGKVDCADTDCTAKYTCASLPSGWQGPVAIWAGSAGAAPSCSASGAYSTQFLSANAGLVAPPYACPSCTCSKSAGMYCDDLAFDLFDTTDCTGDNYWDELTAPLNGGCNVWTLCNANPTARSARLTSTLSSYVHGTCAPGQAAPQFPATSWTSEVRGCGSPASSGGGCGIGQCFPKPSLPFGAALCIFRAGIATCPADYPVQRPTGNQQYYQSVLDGRSCTACSCDPQCSGTASVFTTPNCAAGSATALKTSGGNTCIEIPGDETQSSVGGGGCAAMRDTRSLQWIGGGAACAASTSDVRGAPTPESPVTVCCQQ